VRTRFIVDTVAMSSHQLVDLCLRHRWQDAKGMLAEKIRRFTYRIK